MIWETPVSNQHISGPIAEGTMTTNSSAPEIEVLSHREDRYHGIIVSAKELPCEVNEFVKRLEFSLTVWKLALKRGIWLKIPIGSSHLIPFAVKMGFVYHHAKADYLMLTTWVSELENHLPISATHQVGVGCVVFNSKNEILLVQEKNGMLGGLNLWKVPTGLLDAGEDIPAAAVREVLEETGVRVRFSSILAFRQLHGLVFGQSDLFFVCLLELLEGGEEGEELRPQESEIAAAAWMDVEAFAGQPFMQSSPAHAELNKPILRVHQVRLLKQQTSFSSTDDSTVDGLCVIDYGRHANGFRPGEAAIYSIVRLAS